MFEKSLILTSNIEGVEGDGYKVLELKEINYKIVLIKILFCEILRVRLLNNGNIKDCNFYMSAESVAIV